MTTKLNEQQKQEIRASIDDPIVTYAGLAKKYSVTPTTIRRIAVKQTYTAPVITNEQVLKKLRILDERVVDIEDDVSNNRKQWQLLSKQFAKLAGDM